MAYTLPPVHSLPGYNTSGVPTANPASGRQPFWLDSQGQPIGVTNAGEAVFVPQAGAGYNPLWYGQTAFHTGPTGATDGVPTSGAFLPPVTQAVQAGKPIGIFDAMDAYAIAGKLAGPTYNPGHLTPATVGSFLKLEDDGSFSAKPNQYGIFNNIGKLDLDGNVITKERAMQNFLAQIIDESGGSDGGDQAGGTDNAPGDNESDGGLGDST